MGTLRVWRCKMPKSEGTVTINTPIEKVFDAVADPEVIEQIAFSKLTETKGKPDELGSYAIWLYPVAGMKIRAKTVVSEVAKPRRLVQEMTGTMSGKWIWNLESEGQAATVDFCIEYSVPGGIFGKIADKLFLGRMNQNNMVKTLNNLKAYCEQ
jgi:carbon monoxide dehydrogenase subunit G